MNKSDITIVLDDDREVDEQLRLLAGSTVN